MYKKVVMLLCAFFLFAPLVAAAINDTEEAKIAQAYTCLINTVNNKTTSTLSLQEALFSILALGPNAKAVAKLDDEKRDIAANQTCWPKASCTIKETAQALLAYRVLGRSTASIENYLLSKTGTAGGLTWYLETDIENHVPSVCRVRYSGIERTFTIGSDMKLSGDLSGSCLSVVSSGYWMEIAAACTDKSFEVTCNQSFITTLLYTQSASQTLFVSPTTHSSTAGGFTNESISARCFKTGAECDYEGSLWATMALDEAGKNVASFIPYLAAFAADNTKYLPAAGLYKLTHGQDHYSTLVSAQTNNQYWQAPSTPYNKFYDTAFALLSLQGTSAPEVSNAKDFLLTQQGANGCWENNIRTTAFILYASWPGSRPGGTNPGGSGGGSSVESCIGADPQYACVSSFLLCADIGGSVLDQYFCPGATHCCSVTPPQVTCDQQNGELCSLSEECNGERVDAIDGQCCLGTCEPSTLPVQSECESNGGLCTSSCTSGEVETSDLCLDAGQVCCVSESSSGSDSSGSGWLWIIILLVLIILVVLAILYRRRLQMMLFKRKPSTTSTPVTSGRPFSPPPSFSRPTQSRAPPQRRRAAPVDKEMEETLRKLREMSK